MACLNASTEYLYASARIRAMENSMAGRERLERLLDMKTAGDALASLGDCGMIPVKGADGTVDRESTLLAFLQNAYDTVLEMVPDASAFRFLLYPYDCNNVKAAIKAFLRGIDPMGMMFSLGTVPADAVAKMPAKDDYSALPAHMSAAAEQAIAAYAKTANPQKIDLILDRACYADMLDAAEAIASPYAIGLVRGKIDLVNFMMTLRVLRMGSGRVGRALLEEALLDGGAYQKADLLRLYEAGENRFLDALLYSDYRAFANAVSATDGSLAEIECAADNAWMELVKEAKLIPYGYEVAVGYLIGMEYAVKNVRIIFAGKDAGLVPDVIRERVRTSYV